MATPINDFVKAYSKSGTVRFHMPGHKGVSFHGCEPLDITEIKGADYLYDADGIIGQSEAQTAKAFGTAATLFCTEGSSLCIKTMLGLVKLSSKAQRPVILAPRNVHKAFIDACILLDLDVRWLYPKTPTTSVCCADIIPEQFEQALSEGGIDAVYVTSPDYLGNLADIRSVSQICKAHSVPLLVDNAHGAYTAFLRDSLHPISLGADMCCDSAHKTLPCYTGTAYLHISESADTAFLQDAKRVMSLFGSTSPSYLLLQSLDLCGDMLASGEFSKQLENAAALVADCKQKLEKQGWQLCGSEPMKITVCAAKCGYDGKDLADLLRKSGIEPEYSDVQFVVLMAGVSNTQSDFDKLVRVLSTIPVRPPIDSDLPPVLPTTRHMPIRQAALQKGTAVSVDDALGRICALSVTACQPSVPVVVSGELITQDIVKILKRYSIFSVNVL